MFALGFTGVPGLTYELQRCSSLSEPWESVEERVMPDSGVVAFQDLSPPSDQAFYRVVLKP